MGSVNKKHNLSFKVTKECEKYEYHDENSEILIRFLMGNL
jgi:hypothetical protein